MPDAVLRVYITQDRISQRGPLYTARLHSPDGDIVATGTMEPALAAARALIAKGYDPATRLEMWDAVRPYARLRGQLGKMAKQTVMEASAGSGPRFARYNPVETRFRQDTGSAKEGFVAFAATALPEPDEPAGTGHPAARDEAVS